jgi:hypothetical protein
MQVAGAEDEPSSGKQTDDVELIASLQVLYSLLIEMLSIQFWTRANLLLSTQAENIFGIFGRFQLQTGRNNFLLEK